MTNVSGSIEQAAASSAHVFVRGFRDLDEIGLCPIFQDGYKLGGYGVFAFSHIMHLDCWVLYEVHERGWAPHHLPECPICKFRFQVFFCICV